MQVMGVFKSIKYNLYLFYYVLSDKGTSLKKKLLIIGTIAYFIFPVDFIPELVPYLGITDDAAAVVACISAITSSVTPEIRQKALNKVSNGNGK